MIDLNYTPPAIYREIKPPKPIVELQANHQHLQAICRWLGAETSKRLLGCAQIQPSGVCIVILPRVDLLISYDDQQKIREHEYAHCKGWVHGN